ncbi:MAG: DUF4968 domain-containing protein [Oscillospiraceae bacterium]|nr:DUF4968 domain-containing protein [Oscillospiraceae bacterium]
MLNDNLKVKLRGKANPEQMVLSGNSRITVLTPQLFRIETSPNKQFTDDATQSVWYRDMPACEYSVEEKEGHLFVETKKVVLKFSLRKEKAVSVKFKDSGVVSPCNNRANLRGTKRTLDRSGGKEKLSLGIMSRDGVSVLDDSKSLILTEDGKIRKRDHEEKDVYVFAYYNEYRECLADFYKISGSVPLIPRYALGVWWSRYKAYTQKEYMELMTRFEENDIPLSVATIDMDWHWVNLKEHLGDDYDREKTKNARKFQIWHDGWTGYSWNTELFPDYKYFLKWLQEKKLKVTMNLHPADGVRYFEDQYEEMAKACGVDPATREPVKFSLASDEFINSYFSVVHRPHEDDGVDFWWIDWQQGAWCDVEGLDPLWALNHYHYLDNRTKNTYPLILSRYAGAGSHRYPLGFSGDTKVKWSVLKFQPYFTANANNIGYSWWSHDIGGHYMGRKDNELYIRWLQFGVFSPIMRLHSTNDDLLGKEPWRFTKPVSDIAADWLRLRHKLLPYIHSLNYENHINNIALCEPMYYSYPNCSDAYEAKDQYMFGNLLVAPITRRCSKHLAMASQRVWLPEGEWTDVFSGQRYSGGRWVEMFRDLSSIPVLAKPGTIIPMSLNKGNGTDNPEKLEVLIYRGNGSFTMHEDNGAEKLARTNFKVVENEALTFSFEPEGETSFLPEKRSYILSFKDIAECTRWEISINGEKKEYSAESKPLSSGTVAVTLEDIASDSLVEVKLVDYSVKDNPGNIEHVIDVMSKWQKGSTHKSLKYRSIKNAAGNPNELLRKIDRAMIPTVVKKAIKENL